MEGYIKLHRKILDWEWFDDDFLFKLFSYCLLKANYTDSAWKGIIIPKGSFITSTLMLEERFNVSRGKIRYSLDKLVSTNNITIITTNKFTQINVVNWSLYQSQEDEISQQISQQHNQPLANKKPSNSHSKELKEFKEEKNLKESITSNTKESLEKVKIERFVPPTIQEVKEYCLERKNNIDPEGFVAFYDSKGWKIGNQPMKKWKSAIITWEKKDREKKGSVKDEVVERRDDDPYDKPEWRMY